ncbi:hypothetical protein T492DRAFT_57733 [Pavlovales sp. CCMP2436]|nr:hypothetical protein T492DRAFT_57733 [Pavlovales sp. CCMP2436]
MQAQHASARAAAIAIEVADAAMAAVQAVRQECVRTQALLASARERIQTQHASALAAAAAAEAAKAAMTKATQALAQMRSAAVVVAVVAPLMDAKAVGAAVEALEARKLKRPREDVLPPAQAKTARPEAPAPLKSDLTVMPWEQLSANLRDNARVGAEMLAVLTLRVVASRAHREEGSKAVAVAAGVLTALVAVMIAHPGTPSMQEWACQALASISSCTDAQSDLRRQVAADKGALSKLVAAMGAHSTTVAVQERACWALAKITVGTDARGSVRKQAAVDAGALP